MGGECFSTALMTRDGRERFAPVLVKWRAAEVSLVCSWQIPSHWHEPTQKLSLSFCLRNYSCNLQQTTDTQKPWNRAYHYYTLCVWGRFLITWSQVTWHSQSRRFLQCMRYINIKHYCKRQLSVFIYNIQETLYFIFWILRVGLHHMPVTSHTGEKFPWRNKDELLERNWNSHSFTPKIKQNHISRYIKRKQQSIYEEQTSFITLSGHMPLSLKK